MNFSVTQFLGRLAGSKAGGISWLSALVAILLYALCNLLLDVALPERFAQSTHAAILSDGLAAVLAIVIAPFLLRTLDKMQEQVARQNNELRSLHAIDRAISGTFELQSVLEIAVKEATVAVDGEFGALWLLDGDSSWPKPLASAFYATSPGIQAALTERLGTGSIDLVRRTGASRRWQDIDEPRHSLPPAPWLRNALAVPIVQGQSMLGLVQISNRGGMVTPLDGFTEDDQRLLESVAATVAVAVQNARLYQETLRRDEILRGLVARTGDAIAASSDAPLLMQILADEAARILSCRRVAVYEYVEDSAQFKPLAAHDDAAARDETGQGRVLLERFYAQPLMRDVADLPAQITEGRSSASGGSWDTPAFYVPSAPAALGLAPADAAFLISPGYVFVLRSRDRRGIGLLCLLDPSPRLKQADAAGFARALAAQASVALENAKLSRRTEALLARTQALQAATGQIAAELDTDRVLDGVVDSARRVLDADGYALWGRDTGDWQRQAAWGVQREDASTGQSGEAALLDTVLSVRTPYTATAPDGPVRAQLALPLLYAGRATGVMALYASEPRTFTPDEIGLAQSFANQAASALENARLFTELQAAYVRERHIAGRFQESLLPTYAPRCGTFEFAHKYQAALDEAVIGGDFFDLFPLGDTRIGVVMADVSGKGLAAAVQTALLKYTLRGFALEAPDAPAEVLARLNGVLCSPMSSHDGFVTLFYGVLDVVTGDLSYASAGHEPPLRRAGVGGEVAPLPECDGMVLGAMPGVAYEQCRACLDPGDLLLLYTDGLTEARAADGSFLEVEGLSALLPRADVSASEAVATLYDSAASFADNVRRDDVAILVLRRFQ